MVNADGSNRELHLVASSCVCGMSTGVSCTPRNLWLWKLPGDPLRLQRVLLVPSTASDARKYPSSVLVECYRRAVRAK
jgi:hypothetical protein